MLEPSVVHEATYPRLNPRSCTQISFSHDRAHTHVIIMMKNTYARGNAHVYKQYLHALKPTAMRTKKSCTHKITPVCTNNHLHARERLDAHVHPDHLHVVEGPHARVEGEKQVPRSDNIFHAHIHHLAACDKESKTTPKKCRERERK